MATEITNPFLFYSESLIFNVSVFALDSYSQALTIVSLYDGVLVSGLHSLSSTVPLVCLGKDFCFSCTLTRTLFLQINYKQNLHAFPLLTELYWNETYFDMVESNSGNWAGRWRFKLLKTQSMWSKSKRELHLKNFKVHLPHHL